MDKEVKREHFVFYKSFLDTIEEAEENVGVEYAYAVAKAILEYGVYQEYIPLDPHVKSVMPGIQISIDNADERYRASQENGGKGGAKKKYKDEDIIKLVNEGKTHAEVARILGCCTKTVQRAMDKTNGQKTKVDMSSPVQEFNFM